MGRSPETIRGNGGSVKLGTTGKISTLMSRELESMKLSPPPVMHPSGAATSKRLNPRASVDEASSSGTGNGCKNRSSPEFSRKTRHNHGKGHQIPMLHSDNMSIDETPSREKPGKRGSYAVEIVDVKCGNRERPWATPITSRLKKLSFSKLAVGKI